jgi:uridine phosphorylase
MLPVGAVVIVAGALGYWTLSKSYPPVSVGAATYEHVEVTEVSRVENHFFTVDGVDVEGADSFIQISKYGHPDLTEAQVRVTQTQVIQSFALEPLEAADDRFFGVFRGTVPVYGYMTSKAFVLRVGPQGDVDEAEQNADAVTEALSRVPTEF